MNILRSLVIFVVVIVGLSSLEVTKSSCPRSCKCKPSEKKVTCSNLTFIPEIPKENVSILVLVQNQFYNVTRQLFHGLRNNTLKSLSLIENSIHHITEDAFADLKTLQKLSISKEIYLNISDIGNVFKGPIPQTLNTIKLEENNWAYIDTNMFDSHDLRNITVISLSNNKLVNITISGHLKKLKELDISKNRLITFFIPTTIDLHKLYLHDNNIVQLPSFCQDDGISKVPNLKAMFLNGNALAYLSPSMFNCLDSLTHLYLDSNRFKVLPNNSFSEMIRLSSLSVQHNRQLRKMESMAFNSSSLNHLTMNGNHFHFRAKTFDDINIFKNTPKLEYLDLTENILSIPSSILRKMFRPLDNLKTLILQSTKLKELPRDVFPHLRSLEKLILQGNDISTWEVGVFDNMTNLRYLNIEGNNIHLVNQSSIPYAILSKLKKLDISNNPFSCTCDLMWFRDWIREINKNQLDLKNFPQRYKCVYPESMRNKYIIRYNPTTASCNPWNPLYTVAIILSSFGLLVLVLLFTAYNCHTNIRNYLYLFRIGRRRKQGYLRLDSREDFEYHAFVVYCDADRIWVHNDFLRRLEDDGFKLCIRHRDFDVGTSEAENVDNYMKKCWKVVVIMSNEFAKSDWCQWEVDFVQQRRRKKGKESFILIMLKSINSDHMTSPIKTLMETTPYLTYKKGMGENLFWEAVIESFRKPFNIPPMAV